MKALAVSVLLSITVAQLPGAKRSGAPAPETIELEGTWRAVMDHQGQRGELVVRFVRDAEDRLQASLSLPTIDAWEIATLPVERQGERVAVGPLRLEATADGGLAGSIPESLVPAHRIPFVLRPSEPSPPPPTELPEAPTREPSWVVELGSPIWAGVATQGETVFVGADDGILRALDIATGEIQWTFETGGSIRARPTPGGDTVFVHADDGLLHALDSAGGAMRWSARIEKTPIGRVALGDPASRYDHFAASAVVAGDVVYVGSHEGALVAVDARSGAESWRFEVEDTVSSTPTVEGGRVFFGSFDGRVYAVSAATGEELWRHDTGAPVPSSPLATGGLVILGSRSQELLALDAATGEIVWSHFLWYSWVESSASVHGGSVYVGSSDAQVLSALDASSGRLLWRFDTGGSAWAQPALTAKAVYIGAVGVADYIVDHRGGFYAVDRESGRGRWKFPIERPQGAREWGFASSPAVGKEMILVGGLDGRLYGFRRAEPLS